MIDVGILNKAIALTQKGYTKEAEALYLELLSNEPENYLLLSTLGLFYVNIRDFEKASEYLEKACSIKETLGTVSALGFAEFEKREFEKAAEIRALIFQLLDGVGGFEKNCHTICRCAQILFHVTDRQVWQDYLASVSEQKPN